MQYVSGWLGRDVDMSETTLMFFPLWLHRIKQERGEMILMAYKFATLSVK